MMNYRHILVMIDLSPDSYSLIHKASFISNLHNDAKISLIYVNTDYSDAYTGLIDVDIRNIQSYRLQDINNMLKNLKNYIYFPVHKVFIGNGDMTSCLLDVTQKYNIDLIIFGHYQDFWSKIVFSLRQIINSLHIDMLIVPFY
ncbi:universal stress protein [Buchnera aphidicola str. Bp (Baizongia pistaciae)]|uniref:Universal stress protein A n=1 Tax=Buchnera aphidicola subsp. Baizongia pistaciae (strain Bp) TaxID=224915 RepID=USPA_BUCBP|nr:universal stress protein [Buchnera aphidicola]Q89A25.1 RecName: Full=Universal stress protein A [Buchnera aphidicola str. Bp (Baizongia pistaciae)]AAO27232.1 universal stress protein [Buchnera aphidicola str. Bp (Baizongia pistaciae)]